jgi:hypothetical protein
MDKKEKWRKDMSRRFEEEIKRKEKKALKRKLRYRGAANET